MRASKPRSLDGGGPTRHARSWVCQDAREGLEAGRLGANGTIDQFDIIPPPYRPLPTLQQPSCPNSSGQHCRVPVPLVLVPGAHTKASFRQSRHALTGRAIFRSPLLLAERVCCPSRSCTTAGKSTERVFE